MFLLRLVMSTGRVRSMSKKKRARSKPARRRALKVKLPWAMTGNRALAQRLGARYDPNLPHSRIYFVDMTQFNKGVDELIERTVWR